ncbi:hypothetical protein BpHYR1_053337 [Brachionus plicatilis]|uniref:Uncharacterized protein n=1 Tax=Brachionus plicatilis TaxID=10195 RepID=A0A3M7PKU3_BRAPC|nr:hypothetical protein BpHYR1_053337 [Brachionus plicatilis]
MTLNGQIKSITCTNRANRMQGMIASHNCFKSTISIKEKLMKYDPNHDHDLFKYKTIKNIRPWNSQKL